ncbi:MAG: Holliday junction resolvase RuvX [Bacteroidota bacterium]|nr:Holliday junction resolvase RuvX [Bacteroidota bacterium]MDP4233209.1 Holliday junction resolvase RuvX [Bacteroidota bacterium]MDP4242172.1 Holliday junction resolvase RuvX [Bacteroidota bacterium]MDP4287822.1 Holliday junction resolvase RuvX [Bacteroidota bacterium]
MALDYGTKRVGVAISDQGRMLASARGTIPNDQNLIRTIVALVQAESVRTVLLGIPRTLKNTESAMTSEVLKFRKRLQAALDPIGVAVVARDERLTSIIAGTNIAERGMSKSRREQKGLHDEEAARIILQEYLDSSGNRAL